MESNKEKLEPKVSISAIHQGHTQRQFDEVYNRQDVTRKSYSERIKKSCSCSFDRLKSFLPFIPFFASYKFKSYLFRDILSGLCIGFMGVPQSLGYTRIALIPEVLGLYTSVFPVFIYFFFTSAKHISIGTISIVSLVLRSTIETLKLPSESAASNMTTPDELQHLMEQDDNVKLVFVVSFTCCCGLILIVMSFLRLGFINSFMSEAFISAFLAANLLRVMVFQYKDMLKIEPSIKHHGVLEMVLNSYEIFKLTPQAHLVSVCMGLISLNLLLFFKYFVNEKFKKIFKFPIPVEIIIVIAAIAFNRGLDMENKYDIEILSSIKPGFPPLVLPSPTIMYQYVVDAFLCSVVCFLLVGMMAKLFAQKYGYEIDNNQEMFALGMSGLLGCFFSILPPSTAPARCFLMETTGGKTQLVHLFTAALSLLSFLVFSSLMRDLPTCVLSAIIIAALVPVGRYFYDPLHLYKTNKYDLMIWMVTFFSTLVFSVQEGMVIGIGFSMMVVHVWMLKEARGSMLTKHSNGMFLDVEMYPKNDEVKERHGVDWEMQQAVTNGHICIFKYHAPIFFSTLDSFKNLLFKRIPSPTILKSEKLHLEKLKKKREKLRSEGDTKMSRESNGTSYHVKPLPHSLTDTALSNEDDVFLEPTNHSRLKYLILDFSAVTLMDTHAAKNLASLSEEYKKYQVTVLIAACHSNVHRLLTNVDECRDLVTNRMYPSVADAFIACYLKHNSSSDEPPR